MLRYRWLFPGVVLLLQQQRELQCRASPSDQKNNPSTPVVGVLTQPRTIPKTNETEYYVAASYVKWLELAGARAIPIPYDASDDFVDAIFSQINGLLLPGGASDLPSSAKRLWRLSLAANQQHGDYFPIWATCLGYEYLLMMASTEGTSILEGGFDAENVSLPLKLVNQPYSRLYAPHKIANIVQTENVTLHNHFMGIEPFIFLQDEGLTSMFHITSTNRDGKGRPFVSSIEPRCPDRHPFYGVQFHPEKNAFEYGTTGANAPYEEINHSPHGIYFSVYMAQFFGELLQRSILQDEPHVYTDAQQHPLIYLYPMKQAQNLEQSFVIPSAKQWDTAKVEDDDNGLTPIEPIRLRGSLLKL